MEKVDARTLSTEAQQQLRHQAIRLRKAGRTFDDIAAIVGVHPSTIYGWWKAYQEQGVVGIEIKKRGRRLGHGRRLDAKQEQQLRRLLIDKMPDQLKLPFALWTRRAVQDLIRRRFSIELPIRTVGDYLKRFGFTPQKPLKRAYQQNPKAVQRWLDEDYPAIKKRAKKEGAEIHMRDETGLRQDSQHGRSSHEVFAVKRYLSHGWSPGHRIHGSKPLIPCDTKATSTHMRSPLKTAAPRSSIHGAFGLRKAEPFFATASFSHATARSTDPDPARLIRPRGCR